MSDEVAVAISSFLPSIDLFAAINDEISKKFLHMSKKSRTFAADLRVISFHLKTY